MNEISDLIREYSGLDFIRVFSLPGSKLLKSVEISFIKNEYKRNDRYAKSSSVENWLIKDYLVKLHALEENQQAIEFETKWKLSDLFDPRFFGTVVDTNPS